MHGLVAASHGVALHKENQAFVKERIDVFVYSGEKSNAEIANEEVTGIETDTEASAETNKESINVNSSETSAEAGEEKNGQN